MKRYLEQLKLTPGEIESPAIMDLQNANFVEVSGCVLLQANDMTLPEPDEVDKILTEEKMDRTGYEAFQNHVHLDDIVQIDDFLQQLRSGLAVIESWSEKLKSYYPNYTFHIVLAFDAEEVGNCVVRFYRLRDDETSWIDLENIEGYKLDGFGTRSIMQGYLYFDYR